MAGPNGEVHISVNTSEFVAQFKTAPVQSLDDRLAMVRGCKWVDYLWVNDSQDAKPIIEEVAPDFLVIGIDWATKDYHAQLQVTPEWLAEHDIALLYLDRVGGHSSTNLKARIRESS